MRPVLILSRVAFDVDHHAPRPYGAAPGRTTLPCSETSGRPAALNHFLDHIHRARFRVMSSLYAITFGGFAAFSTYLPTYLQGCVQIYVTEVGTRAAGFALATVVARPIGGILSNRLRPKPVVLTSLAGAVVVAAQPVPEIPARLTFLAMAFVLGIGTGGVFAWVAQRCLRSGSAR
jgi:nitrate/nitrite transporter NarK